MPRRRFPPEAFHMDHLRSSPSQQHLDPTSRSSISSQQDHDDLEQDGMPSNAGGMHSVGGGGGGPSGELQGGERPHKLDLYSIPVFLLECLVLGALGYAAYFVHFQHKLKPLVSGFYCDDISLRQSFTETKFTKQFRRADNELTVLVLLMTVPLAVIIFCELVNSMFGSLKFRQIRSLCMCCKLHSITRRTLRFSGAYLLGFLIVVISCDILATTAGKFRPYFAQECPIIYNECLALAPGSSQPIEGLQPIRARDLSLQAEPAALTTSAPANFAPLATSSVQPAISFGSSLTSTLVPAATTASEQQPSSSADDQAADLATIRPQSPPISSATNITNDAIPFVRPNASSDLNLSPPSRARRDTNQLQQQQTINRSAIERKWIDLTDANLTEVCQFHATDDAVRTRIFDKLALSWPSFPAAVLTYTCLYLACYLSFVGTARPFRLITSVLVMILLLAATMFSVQLVKEHYNHWEDVVGAAVLSLVVVIFVLVVYLNKFRDTHYYENQKFYGSASKRQQQLRRSLMMLPPADGLYKYGYTNEALGQYHLDKMNDTSGHVLMSGGATAPPAQNLQNGIDQAGSAANNDLAMRYFQIPRANYRGAPRPLSSMNR